MDRTKNSRSHSRILKTKAPPRPLPTFEALGIKRLIPKVLSSIGLRAKRPTLRNQGPQIDAPNSATVSLPPRRARTAQATTASRFQKVTVLQAREEQWSGYMGQNHLSLECKGVEQCGLVKRSKASSLDPSLFRIGKKNRTESKLLKIVHPRDARDRQGSSNMGHNNISSKIIGVQQCVLVKRKKNGTENEVSSFQKVPTLQAHTHSLCVGR
jgi:hypothetical protein